MLSHWFLAKIRRRIEVLLCSGGLMCVAAHGDSMIYAVRGACGLVGLSGYCSCDGF